MSAARREGRRARRSRKEREAAPSGGGVWEQVSTLLIAVAIALAIRAFVIEPFRIPSGSMLPTLLIGDHLFVNKFVYGIKVPFTDMRLPALREPRRGDVVVFTVAKDGQGGTYPADQRPDLPTEEFVKRIIGIPGDTLLVRDGVVFLNGERVPTRTGGTFAGEHGEELRVEEVQLGEHQFRILDDPRAPLNPRELTVAVPRTVPEGRYFMMGDNRDHSKDSRSWGTVRLAELKGPAWRLYWSWNFNGTWGQLLNPLTWFDLLTEKMRWDRIGHPVD